MRTAVLVIDVQQGLFAPSPQPHDAENVVRRINALTGRARAAGVPVIFVQHEQAARPLARGSDGWRLHRGLAVDENDLVVGKTTPDAFLRTDLKSRLHALRVTDLIVCGYASEFCVDTTVRRAAGLGYPVQLAADAHTTHDKPHASAEAIRAHHNATLPDITSFGVSITAVPAEAVELNAGGAGRMQEADGN